MSNPSTVELQKAIFNKLSSDVALQGLLSGVGKVYDWVPSDTVFPYVVIGDETAQPFDSQTFNGIEATVTIHSWSISNGRKEIKTIMDRIYDLLHTTNLSMDGQTLILMRFDFSNGGELDPDGFTYHGVQRFRALIQGD